MAEKIAALDAVFDLQKGNTPSDAVLRAIDLARQAAELEMQVIEADSQLTKLKRSLHMIKTSELPDAMAEAGLEEFKLPDGTKISVGDFVSGSLPSDPERRAAAIAWLEASGADGLIKTEVGLRFGKSEHNAALSAIEGLREMGLEPEVKSGVHPSTLQAFVREKMRAGEELPFELLGLFVGRLAKINLP